MKISDSDIIWNYSSAFLKIGSSIIILPFVLKLLPSEAVGIWTIFMTISALVSIFDMGFAPSFTRNVTSVFSGINKLQKKGYEKLESNNPEINYGLLKGLIHSMQWFYLRIALFVFAILSVFGTIYLISILKNYSGSESEIYFSWSVLILSNSYRLYTLYYDSLLLGVGRIKRAKQIQVISQLTYLGLSTLLLYQGYGLLAIVFAQLVGIILARLISFYSFFTIEIKLKLSSATSVDKKTIIMAIYPNAIKVGLTSLGSFLVARGAILLGSLYLSLESLASYGITIQFISVISSLASVYFATYNPLIVQLQIKNFKSSLKKLYLNGQFVLAGTYILGGILLLMLGDWSLNIIGSQTRLISTKYMLFAIIFSLLESNHALAGSFLLSKNDVPFYRSSLIAGGITILLLIIFLDFFNWGLFGMIIAPGIAHLFYNNWKWPAVVFRELGITRKDLFKIRFL